MKQLAGSLLVLSAGLTYGLGLLAAAYYTVGNNPRTTSLTRELWNHSKIFTIACAVVALLGHFAAISDDSKKTRSN